MSQACKNKVIYRPIVTKLKWNSKITFSTKENNMIKNGQQNLRF